jgi:hypothetical protein
MQPVLADEVGIGTTSGREYFQSLFERMDELFSNDATDYDITNVASE